MSVSTFSSYSYLMPTPVKKKGGQRPRAAKIAKINSPVYIPERRIPEWTRILLFTRAGGRCEFDGCPHYLLEHHVTFTEGNFAQFAHIVAFSVDGPRGYETRPNDIHDLTNLMLLCPICHKLIDDNPGKFTRETLEGYKKNHEKQIFHLTGLRPQLKTSVLVVKSKIGNQTVEVPFDHVLEAISPRHPITKEPFTIDLTQLSTSGGSFTTAACEAIDDQLTTFFSAASDVKKSHHISLFALAPQPVLMFLGSRLSNKVPLELFQRHRGNEKWTWRGGSAAPAQYDFKLMRKGTAADKVALVLSLSGAIAAKELPADIDDQFSIYEMTLSHGVPNPTFLNSKDDLENFRIAYQQAIAAIVRDHPGIKSVCLFPAVPAPVAVLCGRECLPRVHPALRVYDNDKDKGGFTHQLTINP